MNVSQNTSINNIADPIDAHVGTRLKNRRKMLGISQEKLAKELDITFQQVQKYERGANRVSASKLFYISKALQVPVTFFFEGMVDTADNAYTMPVSSLSTLQENKEKQAENSYAIDDPLQRDETLELVYWYYRVQDKNQRQSLLEVIKSMARATPVKTTLAEK